MLDGSSVACHHPITRTNRTCGFSLNTRSEEHTSELQSRLHLVCRLLLEKKKIQPVFFGAGNGRKMPAEAPSNSASTTSTKRGSAPVASSNSRTKVPDLKHEPSLYISMSG